MKKNTFKSLFTFAVVLLLTMVSCGSGNDDIEEIIGCVDAIIGIVENKPHKIERMF